MPCIKVMDCVQWDVEDFVFFYYFGKEDEDGGGEEFIGTGGQQLNL